MHNRTLEGHDQPAIAPPQRLRAAASQSELLPLLLLFAVSSGTLVVALVLLVYFIPLCSLFLLLLFDWRRGRPGFYTSFLI